MRPARPRPWIRTAALLACLCSFACAPAPGEQGTWLLFRALESADEVVVGVDEGWREAVEDRLVPALANDTGLRVRSTELSRARAGGRRLRVLLGPAGAPAFERLRAQLGVQLEGGSALSIAGQRVELAAGALVVTAADPRQPTAPLLAVLGGEQVSLAPERLGELRLSWHPGWQLVGPEGVLARGPLAPDGSVVLSEVETCTAPAAQDYPGDLATGWSHEELSLLATSMQAKVQRALGPGPTSTPRLRLWSDPRAFALAHGADRSHRVGGPGDPARSLDLLQHDGLVPELGAALALRNARLARGDEAQPWLSEGLAHWASGSYAGMPLEAWAAHLFLADLVPDVATLVDPFAAESQHVLAPLRGVLFGVLLEGREGGDLGDVWGGADVGDVGSLQDAFQRRLFALASEQRAGREASRGARQAQLHARPFRHGVDLLAGGLEEAGARDPARTAESIGRAGRAGADAVAIEFDAYARAPHPRWALGSASRGPAASLGDLELRAAASAARELELDVLLRPNLVLSPSGTFAGWSLVHLDSSWEELFRLQEEVFVHYALVAELTGVEILCLGSEQRLVSSTIAAKGDASLPEEHFRWKAERWRELVARVRAAYGGGLTYAASWDGERHGFGQWGLFDFMGLELFAPLRAEDGGAPSQAQLVDHMRYELERASYDAESQGLRLLVTAVGFPARAQGWRDPELPLGERDVMAQARCVGALRDALNSWHTRRDEMAGLFVWGWDLAQPEEGDEQSAYAPAGASVETALQRLFEVP